MTKPIHHFDHYYCYYSNYRNSNLVMNLLKSIQSIKNSSFLLCSS
ncbi:Uncharacterized protein CTYZ_00000111 [Cryptosporidium tyzzeri]|nr:Uncharacterized protein CTYZ_00000111 [Cryptosporidium tyzzeri]